MQNYINSLFRMQNWSLKIFVLALQNNYVKKLEAS